jgi:hypothetical protein
LHRGKAGHNEQNFAIGCCHFARRDSEVDDPRQCAAGASKEAARAARTTRRDRPGKICRDRPDIRDRCRRPFTRRGPDRVAAHPIPTSFMGLASAARACAVRAMPAATSQRSARRARELVRLTKCSSAGSANGGRSMAPGISMTSRSRARPPLCPKWSSWTMALAQALPPLWPVHPSPQWSDRHRQSMWHRHRSSSYARRRRSYGSARFAFGERFSYADGLPRVRPEK